MKQETQFDPTDYQDPEHALTLAVKGIRLGGRVKLPDGSMVISRIVQTGPRSERKFAVVPPLENSTVLERHRALQLRSGACNTPTEAAKRALDQMQERVKDRGAA